eukprot:gene8923-12033_t
MLNTRQNFEELEWSDEEFDNQKYSNSLSYSLSKVRIAPSKNIEDDDDDDESTECSLNLNKELKDHKRSNIFNGNARLQTMDSKSQHKNHPQTNINLNEKSIPYVPHHIRGNITDKSLIINIWESYKLYGADEYDPNITLNNLKLLIERVEQHIGYSLNIYSYYFGTNDKNTTKKSMKTNENITINFVDFIEQINLSIRNESFINIKCEPIGIPLPCCGYKACKHQLQNKSKNILLDNNNDLYTSNSTELFRITIIYNELKNVYNGKIRIKHLIEMMNKLYISFDKSKLPKEFWENNEEFIIENEEQFIELISIIRTDQQNILLSLQVDPSLQYIIPLWIKEEFKRSEIMLFELRVDMIRTYEPKGELNKQELYQFFISLGSTIEKSQSNEIFEEYDADMKLILTFSDIMILLYRIQKGTIGNETDLKNAIIDSKAQIHIFEQVDEVKQNPPLFCHVEKFFGNPMECIVRIEGPLGSYYEGYSYLLRVVFTYGYPYAIPDIIFLNRIYSINIIMNIDGTSRLIHLRENWDTTCTFHDILTHVISTLNEPNINLLPERLKEIYFIWNEKLIQNNYYDSNNNNNNNNNNINNNENQSKQEIMDDFETKNGDNIRFENSQNITMDSFTDNFLKNKISKLPRVEQMHLAVLFQYLINKNNYEKITKTYAEQFSYKNS